MLMAVGKKPKMLCGLGQRVGPRDAKIRHDFGGIIGQERGSNGGEFIGFQRAQADHVWAVGLGWRMRHISLSMAVTWEG